MATIGSFTQFGGVHPETACLANSLAAMGVTAPHSGQPYSEAMLLGIGGGLGAGYILWEFKEHHAKVLVLGFQNRWQYPTQFYETLCERIGAGASFVEAGGRQAAARNLDQALSRGAPAIAWVDRAHMPYLQLPEALKGHIGHIVGVRGVEDGSVLVDDLAAVPLRVPLDTFADARARIGSYKNRLLLVTPPANEPDVAAAVAAGIAACAEHLLGTSESFALPAWRKWAKTMTDAKGKKGWPVVFADRRGLYGTLASLYEGIALPGTDGGGLRDLYAGFLDEAAALLGKPALGGLAVRFRDLAGMWGDLADAALPDAVPALGETKTLLRRKYELLLAQGDGAQVERARLSEQLRALHAAHNRAFPMDDDAVQGLFADLGARLMRIYEGEMEAATALQRAV